MRFALVNPRWNFEGSIYFGCPEPHFPLEFGYARNILSASEHESLIVDGTLDDLSDEQIRTAIRDFHPDFTILTTAPTYLFWRCAPPEVRIPQRLARVVREVAGVLVIIGPHGSTTPASTLKKLEADVVLLGEPEELLPQLTSSWREMSSIAHRADGAISVHGAPHSGNIAGLAPILWSPQEIRRHKHHHHRFDAEPQGPGAEVEASRGCPYNCTFCAKENFRNKYRRRELSSLLTEVDNLVDNGVEYIYFIDEIFLPWRELLQELASRPIKIGVQTRIDLWSEDALNLLADAHCVSLEAGIESITEEGRALLDKKCRLDTNELSDRLIAAKKRIAFVQGNLLRTSHDDEASIEAWRERLLKNGVWANKPVPLFPYPGSPEYTKRWGKPDEQAWERAHAYYVGDFSTFSDIQSSEPVALTQLELPVHER